MAHEALSTFHLGCLLSPPPDLQHGDDGVQLLIEKSCTTTTAHEVFVCVVMCCAPGSWDSTICCWDWRSESVIYTCTQHHSDVYGLSIHSSCPWMLASASRDSTLRLWDMRGLAAGGLTLCFGLL